MIPLSNQQLVSLVQFAWNVIPDQMGCDDCYRRMPFYIASGLYNQARTQMRSSLFTDVETHLQQCPCCRDEFDALLAALKALP